MRLLVLLLCLIAGPAFADTPWSAAETLRTEAGRIERLLYRQATPEREAEIASRLGTMRAAWDGAAAAFGPGDAAQALAD
ncbi:MAG TPA: hypothetical protein GXX24_02450, partial [Paracoccus solventivorans]